MATDLKHYEKTFKKLEKVVAKLEDSELSVNDLLVNYKEGLTLVKDCAHMLDAVEEEIQQLISEVNVEKA